jgi:hypothetical protein
LLRNVDVPWLMENDFQPVVGHRFSFRSTPMPMPNWNGIIDSEVLFVEPNREEWVAELPDRGQAEAAARKFPGGDRRIERSLESRSIRGERLW